MIISIYSCASTLSRIEADRARHKHGSERERQSNAPAPGWPGALGLARRAAMALALASGATPPSAPGYPGPSGEAPKQAHSLLQSLAGGQPRLRFAPRLDPFWGLTRVHWIASHALSPDPAGRAAPATETSASTTPPPARFRYHPARLNPPGPAMPRWRPTRTRRVGCWRQ